MPANSMQLRPGQTPLSLDLPPQGEQGGRERRTNSHSRSPTPSSTPSLQLHAHPPPYAPQGGQNGEGGEETGLRERDEPRRVPGQGKDRADRTRRKQCRAQKENNERKNGKESLWLLEAPVRKIIVQMHTRVRSSQCWSWQTQHGLGVCIWMYLVNGTGNSPSPGSRPWSSQTGQVIQGLR